MIKKLTLRDFKTHKDTELELSSGINVITGNSGQGKTNILLGINWVVNNRPLGSNCIRRGQDSGSVSMEVGEDGEIYKVIRSRGKAENSYVVEEGGVALDPFTAGQTPPTLVSEILNLSDLNVQKQRDAHFLVYTPPGQIATYIRSVTKLDEIDRVIKSLSSKIKTKNSLITTQQEELKSINEQLVVLASLNLPLLESKIKDTKIHIEEVKRLKGKVERINGILNDLRALEKCKIGIPDNIDQIFSDVEQFSKSIVEISGCISELKPLIDSIKSIEAQEITLPEDLEMLFTVEGILEEYNYSVKELETILDLLEDIQKIDLKIGISMVRLKQLEFEEIELKEKLENCPSCGAELTERSKKVLLGE